MHRCPNSRTPARTPTRSLRGHLCATLGRWPGTTVWLFVSGVSALLYIPAWCWAQIRHRFGLPFDEGRSIVWCSVVGLGALTAFVTVADLWPVVGQVAVRVAGLGGVCP